MASGERDPFFEAPLGREQPVGPPHACRSGGCSRSTAILAQTRREEGGERTVTSEGARPEKTAPNRPARTGYAQFLPPVG